MANPLPLREEQEAAPAPLLPFAILADEWAAFCRFAETCEDSQPYDVPKPMMKRLAEIGLVRRVTAAMYEYTTFGQSIANGDFAATTPKQEAVTAAVVASPEKLADAIDKLAHFVGWATLAHMKVKFRNDLLAPAQEAMVTLRELQFASTIPRVADHLEDGGKAEAEYDSWIADLRSTLPPALPACTVCGGTGTVVLHDGDAYVCECGGSGVQMNDNPRPDPTALKGWKLHRCPDDKQCRAAIGGGCASGWCEHFGVQAEHIYPNIIPAGPQRTAIGMRREGS